MKINIIVAATLISLISCEWVRSNERKIFKGLNVEQLKSIMRPLEKIEISNHHPYLAADNITVPSQFNWRENSTKCMVPVVD
jgi:hypothetical protein